MSRTYTLLIAEDDPHTRAGLLELLESEGWNVAAAQDGKEAEELFKSESPDLVILDLMMPRRSGFDVLRKVRAADKKIPVLLLSAKSEEMDKVLGLDLGADDFIAKPFGALELVARVRSALRRAYPEENQEVQPADFWFGPWQIKSSELRAVKEDLIKDISPRELKLLEVLATREGKVVARAEFFRLAWDLSDMPMSRTLDQHIATLRKKLELTGRDSLIETVQGVGYRYNKN